MILYANLTAMNCLGDAMLTNKSLKREKKIETQNFNETADYAWINKKTVLNNNYSVLKNKY